MNCGKSTQLGGTVRLLKNIYIFASISSIYLRRRLPKFRCFMLSWN
jgi:hypothetical protein